MADIDNSGEQNVAASTPDVSETAVESFREQLQSLTSGSDKGPVTGQEVRDLINSFQDPTLREQLLAKDRAISGQDDTFETWLQTASTPDIVEALKTNVRDQEIAQTAISDVRTRLGTAQTNNETKTGDVQIK
jgi:hypothetical protein